MPRDKKENLRPFDRLTKSEQRKIAKKGAQKSVEVRRKKRDMKEQARAFLETEIPKIEAFSDIRAVMSAWGIKRGQKLSDAILARIALMAITTNKADWAKLYLELSGEMPDKKVSIDAEVNTPPQVHIYIPDNGRDGLGTTD